MTLRYLILLFATQIVAGCEQTFYTCRDFENQTHANAYAYVLTQNEIQFELTDPKSICMDKEIWDSDGFYKIEHQVQELYRGLAVNLTNQDDVRKVASWVEADDLPHDFKVSSRGTFVVIYSGSPTEYETNKNKLYSLVGLAH